MLFHSSPSLLHRASAVIRVIFLFAQCCHLTNPQPQALSHLYYEAPANAAKAIIPTVKRNISKLPISPILF